MTIDFTQILPQYLPDVQVEIDREGGLSGLPVDAKKVLLVGYKTSAGTAALNAVKRITSETQAMADWGEGSMLACMARAFLDVNPRGTVYGMAFTESAGVQATGTITAATTATGNGVITLWVAGRYMQIGVATGDTATVVGDAIAAAINALPNAPVTAVNATGTVTVTARNKGTEGNAFLIHASITSGIATTISVVAMASGTLAGDPTTALAGIEGERYHLICLGTSDATTLGKLSAHCEKQSGVTVQKWGIGIIGSADTRANAETLATTDDSYNSQIVWQQQAENPVFDLAARFTGWRSKWPANKAPCDVTLSEIRGLLPAYDRTKWASNSEMNAAIEGGLTPIRTMENGTCRMVRSVLTRQTTPSYRDHIVEEIWHYTAEAIITQFKRQVQGKVLKSASPPGRPDTVTPDRATAILNGVLMKLDKEDYLQGVKDSIAAGNNFAEVNAISPTTRLDAAFDFIPVGLAVQIAIKGTLKTPL